MKAIVVLATLLLYSCSIVSWSQSKSYARLYSIYEKENPLRLLKKASKWKVKNTRDPVPYYFLALGYYQMYQQSNNAGRYGKAVYYLKQAKSRDKEGSKWSQLSNEIEPIRILVESKVSYLSTLNRKKALKLSEDYLQLFGDSLPEFADLIRKQYSISRSKSASTILPVRHSGKKRDSIKWIAQKYIGVPYKWAGESPSGFDCSGYVKYVFQQVGVKLPHNANKISYLGQEVSENAAQTGDVILFGTRSSKGHRAYHAGIVFENQDGKLKIIHCISKGVHITTDYDRYWKSRKLLITNVLDYPLNKEVSQKR